MVLQRLGGRHPFFLGGLALPVEVGLLQQALLQLALVAFLVDCRIGQPCIEFGQRGMQPLQPHLGIRHPLAQRLQALAQFRFFPPAVPARLRAA